jgi:membrane protease YdiL (CAAX protease family)
VKEWVWLEKEGLGLPETRRSYLIGLLVIFACVYSQYLVGGLGFFLGALVVYGLPVVAISVLWGSGIIRRSLNKTYTALKFGLGFFGAFTVLGLFVSVVILYILIAFDPSAVSLLNRPNPLLDIPPGFAWTMVWFSLLVVGPAEEYLFRGFMYGGLLSLLKNRHWFTVAFISSMLFAAVHLYYAVVYGLASLIQFTDLVAFGMAMAATYYLSGGNLLVPAIIHGVYDATAFIGVATSLNFGLQLRGIMIFIGIAVAFLLFLQKIQQRKPPAL